MTPLAAPGSRPSGFLDRHARHSGPTPSTPRPGLPLGPPLRGYRRARPLPLRPQYWTANTDPSDRYVQALPGTDGYRLRPDRSGCGNLVLAGDWTDAGSRGCVEAAAVSGLQAANALRHRPRWDRIGGLFLR